MSYFICPGCGERHEIFQHSNRWRPAALQAAPVLGRVPLAGDISRGIDRTHPLMADFGRQPEGAAHPADSAQAAAFIEIARTIRLRLQPQSGPSPGDSDSPLLAGEGPGVREN